MAQLKDLIVNGASQLIGDVYTSQIQVSKINAATSANGTTYGPGTNGQVLLSNGTSVYWGSAAPTITESTVSGWGFTKNAGTVTSVQVQATSPVVSSTSTSQTGSLNTTISLANNYGDTKNPYASKTAHYVLAGPSTGSGSAVPAFRVLVADDIPSLTKSKISDFPTNVSAFTNDSGYVTSSGVTDVTFDNSTKQLKKTINGTTTNIATLVFTPGAGNYSAVGGNDSVANGNYSLAFGNSASATANLAIAFGSANATGECSLAGGIQWAQRNYPSIASGNYAISWGLSSVAAGNSSVAFGQGTTASSSYSVAMGNQSIANGGASLAIGQYAQADGHMSVALGNNTIAAGRAAVAIGQYNIEDTSSTATYSSYGSGARKYLFTVGNGTANDARSNAMTVDWDGNAAIAGSLMVGSSSFGSQLPTTGTAGQIFFQEDNNSYVTQNQIGNAKVFYGVCSTAAGTAQKDVACNDFTSADLIKGAIIFVTFDNTNSSSTATLKLSVNETTACPLKCFRNAAISNIPDKGYIAANQTYQFYYDGTNWVTIMDFNTNTNTDIFVRTYAYSTNIEIPLMGVSKSTTANPPTHTSSYADLYGTLPATTENRTTLNPSTGLITFGQAGLKTGKIIATTALYGDTLPATGTQGQIFFKKLS